MGAGPAPCPTAYGYVALEGDEEAEIDQLHDRIVAFADSEGFSLVEIYVDRNIVPGRIVRPGLEILLDEVSRADGCTVLVPAPDYLSPLPPIRQAIEAEVLDRGGKILILPAVADTHAESCGHGVPGGPVQSRPPPSGDA